MKLLIDTSLDNLFVALIEGNKIIDLFNKLEKRKADMLPIVINDLFKDRDFKDVKEIYITLGPGSFMGARSAYVYARTIAQVSSVKLFVSSSFAFFKNEAYIDAKSGQAYKSDLTLVTYDGEFTPVDYDYVINNVKEVLSKFEEVKDLLTLKPIYLKDPQIGGK